MKKSLFSIFIFFTIVLSSNAYVEEASTAPYVDKFKPSTGVIIKESNIAAKMESATKNAAYGGAKEEKQWIKKRSTPRRDKNTSGVRSYKWF